MKRTHLLLLTILAFAIFSLACGIGDDAAQQIEEKAQEVAQEAVATAQVAAEEAGVTEEQVQEAMEKAQETAQQVAEEAAEQQENVEEAVESAAEAAGDEPVEESLSVGSINENLTEFDSYKALFEMEFDGEDTEGQNAQGSIVMDIEYIKEPPAMKMSMTGEGSMAEEMGETSSMNIYMANGTMYMQNPDDGSWLNIPMPEEDMEDPFAGGFFSPDDIVDLPEKAKRDLLPQDVNGVSTWHYTFDEKDLGDDPDMVFEYAKGEVWIARDEGYPVKMVIEFKGQAKNAEAVDMFGNGIGKISYELRDINQNFTIDIPEEALNAESMFGDGFGSTDPEEFGIDLPDMAEIDFSMEGMLSYSAPNSIEYTVDFFKNTLPAQGWTMDADMGEFVDETGGLLSYTSDETGDMLMISISQGETAESVAVTLMVTPAE